MRERKYRRRRKKKEQWGRRETRGGWGEILRNVK